MNSLDSYEIVQFAKAFSSLGSAVQSQFETLLMEDENLFDSLNPNAVDMIRERMHGYVDDVDVAIDAYYQWRENDG